LSAAHRRSEEHALAPATNENTLAHLVRGISAGGRPVIRLIEAHERPRHELLDRVDRHAAQHAHESAIEQYDADESWAEEVQRL
jgi:hypothetical protein